jgi:hypothetical protein
MRCPAKHPGRLHRVAAVRIPLRLSFTLDGRAVSAETLYCPVQAEMLVLTSCSAELGAELRSAYLAGADTAEVLVAEAWVLGTGPTQLGSRRLGNSPRMLIRERRRALYDHLQRFQDLVAEAGWSGLEVEGVDLASGHLDSLISRSALA